MTNSRGNNRNDWRHAPSWTRIWARPRTLLPALRRAGVIGAVVLVSACSPQFRYHGYTPSEQELSAIEIGRTTRAEVIELLGSPTAGGALNSTGAYYVSSVFRHYGYTAPSEVEREVLAILFDGNDRVVNVESYGLQDGQVVVLSRRVTDDNIADRTFIRQLMGNFGRINAADFLG